MKKREVESKKTISCLLQIGGEHSGGNKGVAGTPRFIFQIKDGRFERN
jgi:hypothetical protein